MHFLCVNVMFHDAVSMIHDIIRTAYPFPYTCTAKFMFVGVKNNKTQQIKTLKDKYNTYVVLSYVKNI